MKHELKQGDIIIVNLCPTKGREQRGKRPVVVISNNDYYRLTGLLMVCPISQTNNQFPMHLPLPPSLITKGAILAQHVRTIDPMERELSFIEKLPAATLNQVLNVINLIFTT